MSVDLIERLELVAAWHTPAGRTPKMPRPPIHTTCRQAINTIERLTAQLAEARQAERAAVVAWLRDDAGKTADDLRKLHAGKKLTPLMTERWEGIIAAKVGIADEKGWDQHDRHD